MLKHGVTFQEFEQEAKKVLCVLRKIVTAPYKDLFGI